MDKPTYTVIFDFDNPNTEMVFNQPSGKVQFPKRIYGETSFEILLQLNKSGVAYSLASMTSAKAYVKVTNSILLPVEISTGATTVNPGEVEFVIDKDVIPNEYSGYTVPGNNYPITLYIVIESSDAGKISLETNIQIMDIDRDGTEEAIEFDGAEITYDPEQPTKWTIQYGTAPISVASALDKLARLSRSDYGLIVDEIATPEVTPTDGQKWLVIATGTGLFTGKENSLMEWNAESSAYIEHTPNEGEEVYNIATDKRKRYNGSAWVEAVDHAISKATLTTATVATGDKVLIQDISASNALKTVTTQAIANLKVTELSEDTTPQQGGNLDVNGFKRTSTTDIVDKLGDAVGANKYSLQDSGDVEVFKIDSNGLINSSSLTASEIVITDASKNLVSAPVATYPSLTELAYGKGVTSAIQTQINAKQATISGASLTAVTIASDDKVLIQDTSDSNNLKTITTLAIAEHVNKIQSSTLTPSGTTQTIDWASGTGNSVILDLGSASGNVTLTLSNPRSGETYLIKVIQGAVSRTLILPSSVLMPAKTAPTTLTITAVDNAVDTVVLYYDGTNYLASHLENYG